MGKQGPCYHCGVTSTPLWRNGPPEKPVLCNACGSRWRTKGTLVNYTPLHARAEPDDYEDHRVSRMKIMSTNKNKEVKLVKRKQHPDHFVLASDYSHGFRKAADDDTSNRSSSGSAVSNTESCSHFGSAEASDLTGPAQSMVWDSTVPSRKRTCFGRPKQSSVEKLTKDLYTILQEQQQSSYFSGSSEEDLLFESETPMISVEIGHGSVLMRHPNSIIRDEESEASSISVDNLQSRRNEQAYSRSASLIVHNNKGVNMPGTVMGKMNSPAGQGVPPETARRDKSQHDNVQILGSQNSPLCHIDLNDIVNYEEFIRQLTNEEQQQLLMYLAPVDVKFPYSLKNMFDSPQFSANIASFQQLLAEGVFDGSLPGAKSEDCKSLKKLALSNSSKSLWVERYSLLKKCKTTPEKIAVSGSNFTTSSNFQQVKRLRDSETHGFSDVKMVMKTPKRVIMKGGYENKDILDYEGSCFSPKSLFALPPDGRSLMLDSMSFVTESSDQDVLLDIPSNGTYPQAELLHPNLTYGSIQASSNSTSMYPHVLHP